MNQDDNNFELSGTLGSLNDAALDNLTQENTNETVTNNNVEIYGEVTEQPIDTEIELLDVAMPDNNNVDANPVNVEPNLSEQTPNLEFNGLDINNVVTPEHNLNPIPTNFDIGDIGSVPPVDPTSKKEKKTGKKGWFIFLVIVFILIIGALIFYYLRISKGTLSNAVVTKEINMEMGEELSTNINDYATFKSIASSNCVLNTKNVDILNAGTYEYSITCGNRAYKGNITIKDSQAPVVKTKTLVKKINDPVNPEEFISECADSSGCTYKFQNPEIVNTHLQQAGTYDMNIIINDASNNSTTVAVKLIVIDGDIKVYLNCVLKDQAEENFAGIVSYIDKIGINTDTNYAGIHFNIKEYTASSVDEYNRIKNEYINNQTLIINNGLGNPIFDDTNLTITIEDALNEAEFGESYSEIKTYYEKTKNYQCNIVNVN